MTFDISLSIAQMANEKEWETATSQLCPNMPLEDEGSLELRMTTIAETEVKKLVTESNYIWPAEKTTSNQN